MQGLGTVLPALLGWTEIVRMLGRAGNQKSAPVWQNWSMERTQWMEQTQLLLQDNSLGSGSSVTSRRKHRSAGVNKLIGACVVAELVPFNVPPLPGGSPATLIAREGSLKCSAGRMCLRDLRAVLVKSGDPSRLIHPRSMGACRAQPVAGEGDRTRQGDGDSEGTSLRDALGKLPVLRREARCCRDCSGWPGFCFSLRCKDTAWAPSWDGECVI